MTGAFERPALVVLDVQRAIDDERWGPRNNPDAEIVIADLLALWRERSLPVVHVRHDSTEPESPYRPGQPGNDFKVEVAPFAGETVVAKRTNSAFIGTDFGQQLRATGCDAVVYTGVLTNNSLEATVRMSGNLGFASFVVSDGCWSVDRIDLAGKRWDADDVHALSLANMHGEYATVLTAAETATRVPGP